MAYQGTEHYPAWAQLPRWVVVGFVAGFVSVLVFHQGAAGLLHALGLTPRAPYSLQPTQPLGVPVLISISFWGGVWGALLAAVSGILIAPVNTIFYDSGFLIGLKAFVGAIIGGLVSFPVTAIGSVFVGILESFAAFLSSPFKEVIVFSILIPVLLWRSYSFVQAEEEDEE